MEILKELDRTRLRQHYPNTADWTLTTKPLESPPALDDKIVSKTLNKNPDLFKIVTPIWVDVFEVYLTTHPNQSFVKSICKGLCEGFWPWTMTPYPGYPDTNDESKPTDFLRAQQDFEVAKDHFLAPLRNGL